MAQKVETDLDLQENDVNAVSIVQVKERVASKADVANYGQFWVKGDTPNVPMFTDGAGTDTQLGLGGVGGAQIDTGTYTGDGTTSQGITGVGFAPKFVRIWVHPASEGSTSTFDKLDQSWGQFTVQHQTISGSEHWTYDNKVLSLDADGFTVDDDGSDFWPNTNGVVFDYLALG